MEAPQGCLDGLSEEAQAIVAAVLIELGMKAGDRRDPQGFGGAEGGTAQGALGGDVGDVRAFAAP